MSCDRSEHLVVNCWCGPRCLSTSLMYSWAQRSDTLVRDEPLYAHYLRVSGAQRPYREKLLAAEENEGNTVLDSFSEPCGKKVLFLKHMAKHKANLDEERVLRGRHVLLLRDPYHIIKSFAEVSRPTLSETCLPALCELYSALRSRGRPPVVILSERLAEDPEGTLRAVCRSLELPFEEAMLRWDPGPKPFDGLWAPWWYSNTHRQTCFQPFSRDRREPLPAELRPLLEECRPFYLFLKRHAIAPEPLPIREVPPTAPGACAEAKAAKRPRTAPCEGSSMGATHTYRQDPRNDDILVGIRDGVTGAFDLLWRPEAKVSVLDSGFVLGDGVWEGIRLHRGVLLFGEKHLDRLYEGAKALNFDLGIGKRDLERLIYATCDANGMTEEDHVHIRVMVTRGLKSTPYQNPKATVGDPTIVIVPEYKQANPTDQGIWLFTCHVRRSSLDVQDPMLNTHSKHNCIAACIQANECGADEALMLDPHGFVATCNSVNFFIVRKVQASKIAILL
mmetsp:Transcript_14705/g.34985  ORF Transcript_14705/g.34985 Transcript_14705/m.34985 type:complete len:505 (-) Transcript_14705:563-2077(-)